MAEYRPLIDDGKPDTSAEAKERYDYWQQQYGHFHTGRPLTEEEEQAEREAAAKNDIRGVPVDKRTPKERYDYWQNQYAGAYGKRSSETE